MELSHGEQAADLLPAPDGHTVVHHWQKSRAAVRKKGNLELFAACPVIYAPDQWPVCQELDYKVIKRTEGNNKK